MKLSAIDAYTVSSSSDQHGPYCTGKAFKSVASKHDALTTNRDLNFTLYTANKFEWEVFPSSYIISSASRSPIYDLAERRSYTTKRRYIQRTSQPK